MYIWHFHSFVVRFVHMASTPSWQSALHRPPVILLMGTPTHGVKEHEIWTNLSFWCLHSYQYHARLRIDSAWFDISPGVVSLVPPGTELEYHFSGPSRHTFVHFDLPRSLAVQRRQLRPAVTTFGRESFRRFDAALREAVSWFPSQMPRAQARVWDLLWEIISDERDVPPGGVDARIERALEQIELRLDAPFCVPELAATLDLSAAQLVRLFNRHVNMSPLTYVHRRRSERAEHLLRHTTIPMKSIARQIGLNDLQQFNKLMRKTLGQSPRQIRQNHRT